MANRTKCVCACVCSRVCCMRVYSLDVNELFCLLHLHRGSENRQHLSYAYRHVDLCLTFYQWQCKNQGC